MKNLRNLSLMLASAMALSACGGGGDTGPQFASDLNSLVTAERTGASYQLFSSECESYPFTENAPSQKPSSARLDLYVRVSSDGRFIEATEVSARFGDIECPENKFLFSVKGRSYEYLQLQDAALADGTPVKQVQAYSAATTTQVADKGIGVLGTDVDGDFIAVNGFRRAQVYINTTLAPATFKDIVAFNGTTFVVGAGRSSKTDDTFPTALDVENTFTYVKVVGRIGAR
jgi:hypothetical protein